VRYTGQWYIALVSLYPCANRHARQGRAVGGYKWYAGARIRVVNRVPKIVLKG